GRDRVAPRGGFPPRPEPTERWQACSCQRRPSGSPVSPRALSAAAYALETSGTYLGRGAMFSRFVAGDGRYQPTLVPPRYRLPCSAVFSSKDNSHVDDIHGFGGRYSARHTTWYHLGYLLPGRASTVRLVPALCGRWWLCRL